MAAISVSARARRLSFGVANCAEYQACKHEDESEDNDQFDESECVVATEVAPASVVMITQAFDTNASTIAAGELSSSFEVRHFGEAAHVCSADRWIMLDERREESTARSCRQRLREHNHDRLPSIEVRAHGIINLVIIDVAIFKGISGSLRFPRLHRPC